MTTKRTRAEYNLERKINMYIRKHKNLHRYRDGGYDLRGLLTDVAAELDLTTPQMSVAKRLAQIALA